MFAAQRFPLLPIQPADSLYISLSLSANDVTWVDDHYYGRGGGRNFAPDTGPDAKPLRRTRTGKLAALPCGL